MILITNGRVITRDPERPYFADGAVLVEGRLIRAIGPRQQMEDAYPEAQRVDAKGGVIMPAFINVHSHIYSALARGLSIKGFNPTNFYEILDGQWWAMDRQLTLEGTRASAYTTIIDGIKTGCVTIFDHHASYKAITGSLFEIEKVAKELGIRACLCYEVSERDGEKKCDEAIEENANFITHCEQEKNPMIAAMFGGHALFTISDKTFEKMQKANNGRTGYHIHVAEGLNDVYDSALNYGTRPVNRLLNNGILGEKTMLGHCIHVNSGEMDIIRDTGTMVCNNAESNMGNAVGCSPIRQMMEKGILVGMGTDSYTFDMLEALKVSLIIQRHNACMPNVAWGEVTRMLFENNAKIASRYFPEQLGKLKEGYGADIIIMDYKPFSPFSGSNIDGHMIFGMTGRQCEFAMCAGKILMQDRKLVGIDEEAICAQTMEQSIRLWKALDSYNG
ncbi:MAG: putative aminohydrolase SsnA [Clostridia bacterium]|nr:putative aminohydrolase SsnA [Clostridia bacterium]